MYIIQLQTDIPRLDELVTHLTDLALQPVDGPAHVHVCKCLAGIINKQTAGMSPKTLQLCRIIHFYKVFVFCNICNILRKSCRLVDLFWHREHDIYVLTLFFTVI